MTTKDERPAHQGDTAKPSEKDLDKALADTFPASDPPAATQGVTGIPDSIQKEHDEKAARDKATP